MLQQEAALQDMVVEAGLQGDYELAVQALSMDPMVPSPQVARGFIGCYDRKSKTDYYLLKSL